MRNKLLSGFLAGVLLATISCARSMSPSESTPAEKVGRETGRSFLIRGEEERQGYGLYSYLLFGSPPTEATRERYLSSISAYMNIPEIESLRAYRPSCELNITYVPLLLDAEKDLKPQWVLDHYDFARARMLLQSLPGTHSPYIISSYKPLSSASRLSGQYLYQDLSSVPPHIVTLWVKEFLTQAEQDQFWEERTAMQCVLKVRKVIEIAAEGYPEVKKSLSTILTWINRRR